VKSTYWPIILLYFLVPNFGLGQEYIVTKYTQDDGLPSDYCYNAVQDDEGLLWIATEAGLVTFDGQNFQTNTFPELYTKEIVEIFKDTQGRIWFLELSGSIYYIEKGKLILFDFHAVKNIKNYPQICNDHNGHIWLNDRNNSFAIGFDTETLAKKYEFNSLEDQLEFLQKEFYLLNNLQVDQIEINLQVKSGVESMTFLDFNINEFYSQLITYDDSNQIFVYDNHFYVFQTKTKTIKPILAEYQDFFDRGIENITVDKHKNLWVAAKRGCFRITNPLKADSQIKEYFNDVNNAYVLIDNLNNIWICSHNQGIIKLRETSIEIIQDNETSNISQILYHNDYLIYGTDIGDLVVLTDEYKEVMRSNVENRVTQIYDLNVLDEDRILVTSTRQINLLDLNNLSIQNIRRKGHYKSISITEDKKNIWINGGQNNYYMSLGSNTIRVIRPSQRSYSSLPTNRDEAYIGSVDGLYKSKLDGSTTKILHEIIQEDIRVITKDEEGCIWVGTQGNGIYVLKDDTLKYPVISLPSRYIHDILIENNNTWVATSGGLCLITHSRLDNSLRTKVIDKSDGLYSNQINALSQDKNNIYAATRNGTAIIKKNFEFDKEVPILKINTIKINERDTTILSNFELNSNQRNIKIDFGGILFNKPGSIEYKYMLSGLDSDWVYTNKNSAQYPSLPAGNYTFFLKAKSLNSQWSDLKKIDFTISQKLSEMLIFKIFLGFIFCSLLLTWFSWYSRARERKRQFKMFQMTALRSQMNPHFIFNSLNSVQDYVLRDDKIGANKYISNFSKLMRYILNASDKEFINLKKELDSLKVYLSIESMRFDNMINYKIEISKNLNPEKFMIPTMLLQPYIENAINHGLKHVKGEKKLYLRIRKYEAGLAIEIEDNGIGRVRSNVIKLLNKGKHESKATMINQKRIELLNKYHQKENKVTFKDIYDSNNKPNGTKVEIFLQSIKFA